MKRDGEPPVASLTGDRPRVAMRALTRLKGMSLLPLAMLAAIHQRLDPRLRVVLRRIAHASIGLVREHLLLFVALVVLGAVCWFFAGWRLRGWRLLLWDLVLPLLAVAAICVIGPGYLFPKEPYEGPHLLTFSPNHALTLLDLPGFACAALAVLLACVLLLSRWRERGRGRRRRDTRSALRYPAPR
jgi:hypothetical protein